MQEVEEETNALSLAKRFTNIHSLKSLQETNIKSKPPDPKQVHATCK
jgi:hypothetical protein